MQTGPAKLEQALDDITWFVNRIRDEARWVHSAGYQPRRASESTEVRGGGYNDPTGSVATETPYDRLRSAHRNAVKQVGRASASLQGTLHHLLRSWHEDGGLADDSRPRLISESEYEHAKAMQAKRRRNGLGWGES